MAKKNKRNDGYLSIRKKLIAAVAMLLVASFMVASSSYAWFTLSTAPEITGIQTSVGANGNLEMALYAGATDANGIPMPSTEVGDSLKSVLDKNLTWGNLVDLSDSAYGLDRITLLPSRLNIVNGNTIATAPLQTPVYGADGRIEELKANTILGSYDANTTSFATGNAANGVSVIGNSTAMTQQQIVYRNNVAAAVSALVAAKTFASRSLDAAGSDLASYAAQHNTKEDKTNDAGPYDLTNMDAMITQLTKAAEQIDAAMIAIATAYHAATNGSDENYAAPTYTATEAAAALVGTPIATAIAEMDAKRVAINTAVSGARSKYEELKAAGKVTSAAWSDLTAVCGNLVALDSITINGMTVTDIKSEENINKLISDVMGGKGVTAALPDNSGTYSDIANITGNYSAGIMLKDISYKGLAVPTVSAVMETKVTKVVDYKTGFPDSPTGTSSNPLINDMYGYKIDMAFRTNATSSKLMLQTEAVGRIYSSGASSSTMGKGSTMSVTSTAPAAEFGETKMKDLMEAIRIVFTDNTGAIVALAGLDTSVNANADGSIDAPVRIIDKNTYTIGADGVITFTGKAFVDAKDAVIMPLDQNQTETLSVYVYLDGDYVTNSDVAATVAKSMAGTLNLQFSSSAALVPMNYAPLAGGDSMGGGTQTPENP